MKKTTLLLIGTAIIIFVISMIYLSGKDTPSAVETTAIPDKAKVSPEPVDFTERYTAKVGRVNVVFEQKDYNQYRLTTNGLVREGELNTERGFEDDEDATVYVLDSQKSEGEQTLYVRLTDKPGRLYALDGNRKILPGSELTLEP